MYRELANFCHQVLVDRLANVAVPLAHDLCHRVVSEGILDQLDHVLGDLLHEPLSQLLTLSVVYQLLDHTKPVGVVRNLQEAVVDFFKDENSLLFFKYLQNFLDHVRALCVYGQLVDMALQCVLNKFFLLL